MSGWYSSPTSSVDWDSLSTHSSADSCSTTAVFPRSTPNSFLNILAFIVVCEAFLRIPPHFRLWLKIFNVKPKVVGGQHAECGGAMVSKMPNVTWPKGTFVETVKGWQQQWFYVTEPRDATWAAAPEFQFGALMRLTSWLEKGLDWARRTS